MMKRIVVLAVLALTAAAGCRSLDRGAPLDLSNDGVQGSAVLVSSDGQTLVYNLRAIEPGVLYRASDFNRARPAGDSGAQPAAFRDGQLFNYLKSLNVHHVISLLAPPEYYAEEGYFKYWTDRGGYSITTSSVAVARDDVYGTNDRSGVHAAAELLAAMIRRKPEDGAVLIHGEAGKDAIGVMAAAYELARTVDRVDDEAAWNGVVRRYLASNTFAAPQPESAAVTAASLERIKPQLMFLARLF
jgi:protein tyrosine/serine phosphatase